MIEKNDYATLNLPSKEFKNLILKSLKAKEPVYFYCSTTSKRVDGVWIDTMERYGELFGIDLKLDNNSILIGKNGIILRALSFIAKNAVQNEQHSFYLMKFDTF